MSYTMDSRLVVLPHEQDLPRWVVERRKLDATFPQFRFVARGRPNRIVAVRGTLWTNEGVRYGISIEIPPNYPYAIPEVHARGWEIDEDCPHKYSPTELCLMRPERWSRTLTIAFLVAKTALWLNKYDVWLETGEWIGSDEHKLPSSSSEGSSLLDEILNIFGL